MEIEARLRALKVQSEKASQDRLRSEMEAENALKERDAHLKMLEDEFDVKSVEEAMNLRARLQDELSTLLEEAESTLGEVS